MSETSQGTNCDCALVAALQAGSAKAFRYLFDKYHQKILLTSRKMGLSCEDAEGVVQEIFLLIWEKRQALQPGLSFNAFLLTLTKRTIIKMIRHDLVSKNYLYEVLLQRSISNNSTEDFIIFNDLESFALDYIEAMPPVRKEIFLLSKREGLSNDEIARHLHVSKRTVENQLYRAIKSIRAYLQKENHLPPIVLGMLLACLFL